MSKLGSSCSTIQLKFSWFSVNHFLNAKESIFARYPELNFFLRYDAM